MPPPAAERGSATVTVATAAALLLLLLAVIAGAVGGITGQEASACTAQPAASSAAASIPANYLADFKKRHRVQHPVDRPGRHRRSRKRRRPERRAIQRQARSAPCSSSRRPGRCTEKAADIMNPDDAIPAAARLLVANARPATSSRRSSPTTRPSRTSADPVQAARYAAGGAQVVSAAGSAVCQQAALGPLPAGTAGKILAYAEAQLGKSYQYGATGPDAFDCRAWP